MRCDTRSGWRTAYAIATAHPWEIPSSANRATCAASATASKVDADAEEHAARLGHPLVARRHDGLDLDRALGRVDHAGELGQDAIAGRVGDRPAVAPHQRQAAARG